MSTKRKYRKTELIPIEDANAIKEIVRAGVEAVPCGLVIVYWITCLVNVPFAVYAAHWIEANMPSGASAMRARWPLIGPRMIADNMSEWGSYRAQATQAAQAAQAEDCPVGYRLV